MRGRRRRRGGRSRIARRGRRRGRHKFRRRGGLARKPIGYRM